MRIEIEREDDGRWIAEVPDLPGVLAYGHSRDEAVSKAQALALRMIADRPGKRDGSSLGVSALGRVDLLDEPQ